MSVVTLSSKYQVVIPREIREGLGLQPGEKLQIFRYADRIEFVPVRPLAQMRGFLPLLDTDVEREDDRV